MRAHGAHERINGKEVRSLPRTPIVFGSCPLKTDAGNRERSFARRRPEQWRIDIKVTQRRGRAMERWSEEPLRVSRICMHFSLHLKAVKGSLFFEHGIIYSRQGWV
jgi:hypothetical protein